MPLRVGKVRNSGALAILLGATALAGFTGPARAAPADDLVRRLEALEKNLAAQSKQLQQQQELIEAQAAQIQDLKRTANATTADIKKTADEAPKLSVSNGRPSFSSGDGNFTVALRGVAQFDAGAYFQKGPDGTVDFRRAATGGDAAEAARARDLNSGTNFRRARIGIDGTVFKDWQYSVIYEFAGRGQEDGGRINDAWVSYNGFKPFRFIIGATAPSANLDDATSATETVFIERASPAEIDRAVAGGDGRSLIALRAAGDTYSASAALTGNVINTPRDASQAFPAVGSDEQTALVARATYLPYKTADALIHFGGNLTWVFTPGQVGDPSASGTTGSRATLRLRERPELAVDGTRFIDTGTINADSARLYGAELAGQWRNFYGQGEYFHFAVDRKDLGGPALADPRFHGWYVQASWVLTGEKRSYNTANGAFGSPRPAKPFDLTNRGPGAWELALRFSDTDLNSHANSAVTAERVRGGRQKVVTVGLNWYPNSVIRFLLNYQHVDINRLNPGGYSGVLALPSADTPIGQSYNAMALRAQLAF